jgi:MFS family permease
MGVTSIAGVLGAVLTPMISKSSSRKNVHIVCQVVSCIAYVLLALFGKNQILFIVMRAIATFVGMPSTILMTAMANDIGDQMEMNGEQPPRAFQQSLAGTANRAGLVISAALGSSVLVAIGYEAGVIFTDAMKTSLTTYIAALPAFGSSKEQQLRSIMIQKWIALYPNSAEAWAEQRRTGYPDYFSGVLTYPAVSASSGVSVGNIIQRIPYPQNEYNTNAVNVPAEYADYNAKNMEKGISWSLGGENKTQSATAATKNF